MEHDIQSLMTTTLFGNGFSFKTDSQSQGLLNKSQRLQDSKHQQQMMDYIAEHGVQIPRKSGQTDIFSNIEYEDD